MRALFCLRPAMPHRGPRLRVLRSRTSHCFGQGSGLARPNARGKVVFGLEQAVEMLGEGRFEKVNVI